MEPLILDTINIHGKSAKIRLAIVSNLHNAEPSGVLNLLRTNSVDELECNLVYFRSLEQLGVILLDNKVVRLDDIVLGGVGVWDDDYEDVEEWYRTVDELESYPQYKILLCHQPESYLQP